MRIEFEIDDQKLIDAALMVYPDCPREVLERTLQEATEQWATTLTAVHQGMEAEIPKLGRILAIRARYGTDSPEIRAEMAEMGERLQQAARLLQYPKGP